MKPSKEHILNAVDKVRLGAEDDLIHDYPYLGIRSQSVPFELGPMNWRSSHRNAQGEFETLGGVSTTDINTVYIDSHAEGGCHWRSQYGPKFLEYPGQYVAVLGSQEAHRGEDTGELVLVDPEVLYIVS